jgi:hypothetical protein
MFYVLKNYNLYFLFYFGWLLGWLGLGGVAGLTRAKPGNCTSM